MKTDIIISELKKGDKLYSTIHGNVIFVKICENDKKYPIEVIDKNKELRYFTLECKYHISDLLPALFRVNPFKEVERVVLVSQSPEKNFVPRVLIAIKNNKAICWHGADSIEDSKNRTNTHVWDFWKEIDEIPKMVELTFQDISDGKGVGIDPKLIKITI